MSVILEIAFLTLFPPRTFISPSLNSRASNFPVDAPEGTILLPTAPHSRVISTSTVGLALESKICLAFTPFILKSFII